MLLAFPGTECVSHALNILNANENIAPGSFGLAKGGGRMPIKPKDQPW